MLWEIQILHGRPTVSYHRDAIVVDQQGILYLEYTQMVHLWWTLWLLRKVAKTNS